jgi:hypothetical protein
VPDFGVDFSKSNPMFSNSSLDAIKARAMLNNVTNGYIPNLSILYPRKFRKSIANPNNIVVPPIFLLQLPLATF